MRIFTKTARLAAPNWPTPLVNEEFMRWGGIVRKRKRGGLSGLLAEEIYCEARRSIRFTSSALDKSAIRAWRPRIVFRRFFFDGTSVGRYEIGLELQVSPSTKKEFEELLRSILDIQVAITLPWQKWLGKSIVQPFNRIFCRIFQTGTGSRPRVHTCSILQAGHALALLYTHSSTPHGSRVDTSLVAAGTPAVFIAASAGEFSVDVMPSPAQRIPLKSKELDLFHWWYDRGRMSHIWVCLNEAASPQELRNLRIYILRLNSEHESFVRILKAISGDRIAPNVNSPEFDALQTYLNEATANMLSLSAKTRKFAENDSNLLSIVAAASEETISQSERESLLKKLDDLKLRKNIFRKVRDHSASAAWTGISAEHKPPARTVNALFYIERFGRRPMGKRQSVAWAFAFGVLFVAILLIVNLAVANPTQTQWITFRIILALAAGGVGAMIPGFLNVDISPGKKFALHAGGALAVFVIVYFFSPGLPPPMP